jgi:hypothetical protein
MGLVTVSLASCCPCTAQEWHDGEQESTLQDTVVAGDVPQRRLEDLVTGSEIAIELRDGSRVKGSILRMGNGTIELLEKKNEGFGRFHDEFITIPFENVHTIEFPRRKWSEQNWLLGAGVITGVWLFVSIVTIATH